MNDTFTFELDKKYIKCRYCNCYHTSSEFEEFCRESRIQDASSFHITPDDSDIVQQLEEKVNEMDKENRKLFLDAVNANFALALQITDLQSQLKQSKNENKELQEAYANMVERNNRLIEGSKIIQSQLELYQKANEELGKEVEHYMKELDQAKKAVEVYKKYVAHLDNCLNKCNPFLYIHSWTWDTDDIELGQSLRNEIKIYEVSHE
jgi:predicted RNase H-like nuclease (RuvC/YqgF family)